MHWPHNNVFIICPNEIYKYDYGLQKSVASKIDIQDVTQGIILNITGPPFSPRHRTESVRQFLIKLQQRCPICSIPVANSVWAKKLFAQMPSEDQMSMLWHTILSFFPSPPVRENIFTHIFSVQKRAVELSQQHFSSLRLTNNEGTDLLIQLHPRHQWITSFKNGCCANILTNEVYTIPLKDGVTGIYKCRGPAEIDGAILHNIEFSFASGKATIVNVEGDSRHLEELLDMDYGSAYMGEIALVMDEEVKVQKKVHLTLYWTKIFFAILLWEMLMWIVLYRIKNDQSKIYCVKKLISHPFMLIFGFLPLDLAFWEFWAMGKKLCCSTMEIPFGNVSKRIAHYARSIMC